MRLSALWVAALAAATVGCSFHLRRAPDLPPVMQHLYVVSSVHDAVLVRELRRGLGSESNRVVDDPTQATATLSIINLYQRSRPLVLSNLGQPLEYQVAYSAEYTLVAGNVVLIPPEIQTLTRNYNYNVNNGIANEEQEQTLYRQMAKDMAQLIIFRLQAVAKYIPRAATTVPPASATLPLSAVPAQAAASHGPPVVQ